MHFGYTENLQTKNGRLNLCFNCITSQPHRVVNPTERKYSFKEGVFENVKLDVPHECKKMGK